MNLPISDIAFHDGLLDYVEYLLNWIHLWWVLGKGYSSDISFSEVLFDLFSEMNLSIVKYIDHSLLILSPILSLNFGELLFQLNQEQQHFSSGVGTIPEFRNQNALVSESRYWIGTLALLVLNHIVRIVFRYPTVEFDVSRIEWHFINEYQPRFTFDEYSHEGSKHFSITNDLRSECLYWSWLSFLPTASKIILQYGMQSMRWYFHLTFCLCVYSIWYCERRSDPTSQRFHSIRHILNFLLMLLLFNESLLFSLSNCTWNLVRIVPDVMHKHIRSDVEQLCYLARFHLESKLEPMNFSLIS